MCLCVCVCVSVVGESAEGSEGARMSSPEEGVALTSEYRVYRRRWLVLFVIVVTQVANGAVSS